MLELLSKILRKPLKNSEKKHKSAERSYGQKRNWLTRFVSLNGAVILRNKKKIEGFKRKNRPCQWTKF